MNTKLISSIKDIYVKYEHFIFDMDGVLWHGDNLIESGRQAVQFLIQNGKNVCFYTNNSTKSRSAYQEKLKNLGMEVRLSQVYSSSYIVASYAKNTLNTKRAYVVGMQGILDELNLVGIGHLVHENMITMTNQMYQDLEIPKDIDTVIVGFDQSFTYYKLCYASLCIQKGAKFVNTSPDSYEPVGGYKMPITGCIVAAIAKSVQMEPVLVGKPDILGYDIISREQNFTNKSNVLMIGDNLETDIAFGLNAGIDTVVVLTGVTNREEALSSQAKYVVEKLF